MSQLLRDLELASSDAEKCGLILHEIVQIGQSDPDDRARSWQVISQENWYYRISENYDIPPWAFTEIFRIVVIPDLTSPAVAEVVVKWACSAPPPMIGGLLAAAKIAEMQQGVMHILEPVFAARWADENSILDQWDRGRIMRAVSEFAVGDHKRGVRDLFRRH